jgi:hypothetical protein
MAFWRPGAPLLGQGALLENMSEVDDTGEHLWIS